MFVFSSGFSTAKKFLFVAATFFLLCILTTTPNALAQEAPRPGTLDPSFSSPLEENDHFNQLFLQESGHIITQTEFRQKRIGPDGAVAPLALPVPSATILAQQPDGKFLISPAREPNAKEIILFRVHADLDRDETFQEVRIQTDSLSDPSVLLRVLLRQDGRILLGGTFRSVNGFARNGLVLLNPDGSVNGSFLPEWRRKISSHD
jgi:hypothetical protein